MKRYIIFITFLLLTISIYSQKQFIETYGSELTLNCSNTSIFEILLRGNVTLSLSNTSGSKSITIWLVQDNIGSRTVSFSNQFTFTSLNTDSVTTTANTTTVLGFNINNNKTYCSYSSVSKGGSGSNVYGVEFIKYPFYNFKVDSNSLNHITTGYSNIGIGQNTLTNTTTGFENIAIGRGAGNQNTIGNNNIFLGYGAAYNLMGQSNLLVINSLSRNDSIEDVNRSIIYGIQDNIAVNQILNVNAKLNVTNKIISTDTIRSNKGIRSSSYYNLDGSPLVQTTSEDTLYISAANILSGINDTLVTTNTGTTQTYYTQCLLSYRHVSTAYTGGTTDTIAVFGKYKGVKKKLLYISSSYITDTYSGRGQFPITWDKLDPGSPIWVHIPSFSTGNGILRMRFIKKQETW